MCIFVKKRLYACGLTRAAVSIQKHIVGRSSFNEGKGISNVATKAADEIISIPMSGQINSLNASVAAAILIFNMIGE